MVYGSDGVSQGKMETLPLFTDEPSVLKFALTAEKTQTAAAWSFPSISACFSGIAKGLSSLKERLMSWIPSPVAKESQLATPGPSRFESIKKTVSSMLSPSNTKVSSEQPRPIRNRGTMMPAPSALRSEGPIQMVETVTKTISKIESDLKSPGLNAEKLQKMKTDLSEISSALTRACLVKDSAGDKDRKELLSKLPALQAACDAALKALNSPSNLHEP